MGGKEGAVGGRVLTQAVARLASRPRGLVLFTLPSTQPPGSQGTVTTELPAHEGRQCLSANGMEHGLGTTGPWGSGTMLRADAVRAGL